MPRSTRTSPRWLLLLLGVAALLLDVRTAASLLPGTELPADPPDLVWLAEPEAAPLRAAAAGRYATGRDPGARTIVLTAEGKVSFGRTEPGGERIDRTEHFKAGHRGSQLWLKASRGMIEVESIDALRYFGDEYKRTR